MSRIIPVAQKGSGVEEAPVFQRIAIVGFGLIGGSIGLAAKQRWPTALVIAVDRKDVLETAMRMNAADVAGDDLVMAAEADLIVLAAPVRQNLAILEQIPTHVPGEAVVTDVGSTKVETVRAGERLPDRLRFVGGHPLAGAAAGGLEAARPDLFAARPWLLTPAASSRASDVAKIERLIEALGGTPHRVDAETHDQLVAYLSHLPQLTISALMHVVGEHTGGSGLALAGRGLRETTRLASSPASIWRDIAATNDGHIGAALDALIEVLTEIRRELPATDTLDRIFESANRWKGRLENDR